MSDRIEVKQSVCSSLLKPVNRGVPENERERPSS
jgi:hypothetical protein